jgi:hypothetical protein
MEGMILSCEFFHLWLLTGLEQFVKLDYDIGKSE